MATLFVTYAVAWAAVAAYVARLAIVNHRLSRRLTQLKDAIEAEASRPIPSRRAVA
jgi:hypothetical protein